MKKRKEEMLTALLTNPSIRAACAAANVPEATCFEWLRSDAEFKTALNERLETLSALSFNRLKNTSEAAVSVLEGCLASDNLELAFRAASKVLDLLCKYKELYEVDQRLTALERPSQSIKVGDKTIYF